MIKNLLTAERLRNLISYDSETGIFNWNSTGKGRRKDRCAGSSDGKGYLEICIDYQSYRAHRLAWLYVHGEWPEQQIDHINGNKKDNRISNLRTATNAQNAYNTKIRSNNTSGYKGVTLFKPTGKYAAKLRIPGKIINLGYFDTAKEAAEEYSKASKKYHGEFSNTGAVEVSVEARA